MTIACLIPARYNSTRFPGKLLALALGKTVLQRTIESALQYFEPSQVFVATDDERIAKHVEELGVEAIWTLPSHINGSERIAEAIQKTPKLANVDIIVNLQGDHPCMSAASLQAAIDVLAKDPQAMMSTIATPIHFLEDFLAPQIVKVVVGKDNNALYFSRSPIPYSKNGMPNNALQHIGLYCFRRDFLLKYPQMISTPLQIQEDLEQLKVLEEGFRIKVAIVNETCIGVDIPSDLSKLEELLNV
jgi:3-deoxy-manno-octulosonate cytidylyltransferase (CMP-KDO synthetase)